MVQPLRPQIIRQLGYRVGKHVEIGVGYTLSICGMVQLE